jgi:hypothetical protein
MQYLIGASDDAWKPVLLLAGAFDHGFDDTRVVGTQVHKAMADASGPESLEKGE